MNSTVSDSSQLEAQVWEALLQVPDPEIPPLSVVDLGIISKVEVSGQNVLVTMTPTFSGCPAIHMIRDNIATKVAELCPGLLVEVLVDFENTWNSNKITEKGREVLANFRLTPPRKYEGELDVSTIAMAQCPHCGSENTTMNTPFGPTLCRSIHYCFDCLQSFEQFKPV
jgi:ring-1,2-phenylacetyl-CoA epoxidase subunit PaaD